MSKSNCKTSFEFECKGQDGCDFRTKHEEHKEWCGENYEGYCTSFMAQKISKEAFVKRNVFTRELLKAWRDEEGCVMAMAINRLMTSKSFTDKPFSELVDGVDYILATFAIYSDANIINGEITFDLIISSESENIAAYMDLDDDSRDMLEDCQTTIDEVLLSHDMEHAEEVYNDLKEMSK